VSGRWVPLDVADTDSNPFRQFQRWFDEADGHMAEREAVSLATATTEGVPSVRMVLLRHHDETSFGWYTNYDSRKGRELATSPKAALLWYCEELGRQIRIEGDVEKMTAAESNEYFASRPRGSQLGARASKQSDLLDSRATLENRVREYGLLYNDQDVPRPANWGGYRLLPNRFEFWQHREDRLHDRIVYREFDDAWRRSRISP
jgi:pyridoxamine 5'-phosphate oxidase